MGYRTIKSNIRKRFSPKPKRSRDDDDVIVVTTAERDSIEEEQRHPIKRAWWKVKNRASPLRDRLLNPWRRISPRRHQVVDTDHRPPIPKLRSKDRAALEAILPTRPKKKSKSKTVRVVQPQPQKKSKTVRQNRVTQSMADQFQFPTVRSIRRVASRSWE